MDEFGSMVDQKRRELAEVQARKDEEEQRKNAELERQRQQIADERNAFFDRIRASPAYAQAKAEAHDKRLGQALRLTHKAVKPQSKYDRYSKPGLWGWIFFFWLVSDVPLKVEIEEITDLKRGIIFTVSMFVGDTEVTPLRAQPNELQAWFDKVINFNFWITPELELRRYSQLYHVENRYHVDLHPTVRHPVIYFDSFQGILEVLADIVARNS